MPLKLNSIAPHLRFREARERLGLSIDDVAHESGISSSCIWDIESFENELASCYSPKEAQLFSCVLRMRPVELFADDVSGPAISADQLVALIHSECRTRGVTLEQFEDIVGWRLSACIDPPGRLLKDMSIDGLQWLCRELRIDWRNVLLSL